MTPESHAILLSDPAEYLRLAELGEVPLWWRSDAELRLFLARWFREELPARAGIPHTVLVLTALTLLYPDVSDGGYRAKMLMGSPEVCWWPVIEEIAEIHGGGRLESMLARLADAAAQICHDVANVLFFEEVDDETL